MELFNGWKDLYLQVQNVKGGGYHVEVADRPLVSILAIYSVVKNYK